MNESNEGQSLTEIGIFLVLLAVAAVIFLHYA